MYTSNMKMKSYDELKERVEFVGQLIMDFLIGGELSSHFLVITKSF